MGSLHLSFVSASWFTLEWEGGIASNRSGEQRQELFEAVRYHRLAVLSLVLSFCYFIKFTMCTRLGICKRSEWEKITVFRPLDKPSYIHSHSTYFISIGYKLYRLDWTVEYIFYKQFIRLSNLIDTVYIF